MIGAGVERHVVIITTAGSFNARGDRLTGPVDAVDKLEKLIDWAHQRGGLRPVPVDGEGEPEPARIWMLGEACALLGARPRRRTLRSPIRSGKHSPRW